MPAKNDVTPRGLGSPPFVRAYQPRWFAVALALALALALSLSLSLSLSISFRFRL